MVKLSFENLLAFCSLCKYIEHTMDRCHRGKPIGDAKEDQSQGEKASAPPRMKGVRIGKKRRVGIGSVLRLLSTCP